MRECVTVMLLSALLFCAAAQARMYQWINPNTRSVQLSGEAPAWYRNTAEEDLQQPRVFVFENGKLVDDTAVPVSTHDRARLRRSAFGSAGARTVEPQRSDIFQQLKETVILDEGNNPETAPVTFSEEPLIPAADSPRIEQSIEELKAVIKAWDAQQSDRAKSILAN